MRIRIDFAYDGTEFNGWAIQPGLRTVQGEIQSALSRVLRTEGLWVTIAGRTDAGVHARGQVLNVDVDEAAVITTAGRSPYPPLDTLAKRLNGILTTDIRIHKIREVPSSFDARYSALWRRYAYRVVDKPALYDPLTRNHVLHWQRPLNLDLMNEAAADLVGLHDFASFCKPRPRATTIRELRQLTWHRDSDGVAVADVMADAFCHSMVRSLVGCLISIGEGRRSVDWARTKLADGARSSDLHIAPARGLTLEEVGYPADDELEERLLITRNRRDQTQLENHA